MTLANTRSDVGTHALFDNAGLYSHGVDTMGLDLDDSSCFCDAAQSGQIHAIPR